MQTSYPVFENGQVLSATHLNDLAEYLEEQDRLTRTRLIGIGIACGLDVSYDAVDNIVRVSLGSAVTSEGYLIAHDESFYDRFRPYILPVPETEEAPDELFDAVPYPFFHRDGEQIELFELISTGFEAGESDEEPDDISASFIEGKVALIFLEHNLESLKNCDINDCSDRGSEIEFAPRVLVASKEDAQRMLDLEEELAQRPVHRGKHPGYELEELRIEKLRLAAHNVDSFSEFIRRVFEIAAKLGPQLTDSLRTSYDAFEYLLRDGYPVDAFPDGPFGDPTYFSRLMAHVTKNIVACQYFYGYMADVVASYNEFLRAAVALESECAPNSDRFPLHVLLGELAERPTAFAGDPLGTGFEPLKANSGFGVAVRPAPFRHHFIPSPLFDRHHGGLQRLRSLHYRTFLLAYRFATDGLLEREIRITPSKPGEATLSERAIPFYYALRPDPNDDDLARNWSFTLSAQNRLDRVFSHQYVDASDHPLNYRMDGHDFYRVEGTVGKGLGETMRSILQQKRALGLSFGVEPVFIGLSMDGDENSLVLEREARENARQVLTKLVACRMRELDMVFLVLMSAIFQYLVAIITLLSRTSTSAVAGLSESVGRAELIARRSVREVQLQRELSGLVLRDLRGKTYEKGFIAKSATENDDPVTSLGMFYEHVRDAPSTENLFDRTLKFTHQSKFENADQVARRIYPSVSLLDKAEELAAATTTRSLADFDMQDFEVRYDGFVQAFDAYLEQDIPEAEAPRLKAIRGQLAANYGSIAATAPQSVLTGMVEQLRERMNGIFGELLLGKYAQRHPGAEHMGGVPAGGTLVLLYTHRSFVARLLKEHREIFERRAEDVAARFTTLRRADVEAARIPAREFALADTEPLLALRRADRDPLDEFVVLGDLCLPYLCCDSDCSDISLDEEAVVERPVVRPGTVRGTIVLGEGRPGRINVAVLDRASVSVINEATRESVDVETSGGEFVFTAPPGTFRISVKGPRGVAPVERLVTVKAGGEITEDVVLRRRA